MDSIQQKKTIIIEIETNINKYINIKKILDIILNYYNHIYKWNLFTLQYYKDKYYKILYLPDETISKLYLFTGIEFYRYCKLDDYEIFLNLSIKKQKKILALPSKLRKELFKSGEFNMLIKLPYEILTDKLLNIIDENKKIFEIPDWIEYKNNKYIDKDTGELVWKFVQSGPESCVKSKIIKIVLTEMGLLDRLKSKIDKYDNILNIYWLKESELVKYHSIYDYTNDNN
jgi:hypothetical protein